MLGSMSRSSYIVLPEFQVQIFSPAHLNYESSEKQEQECSRRWAAGRQKDTTTTFLDGMPTLDRPFFSFFPLFFLFSLFLFVLLKGSPQSFPDNFPVIQENFY